MFTLESKTELRVTKAQNYIGGGGTSHGKRKLGGGRDTAHFLDWGNKWVGEKNILGGGPLHTIERPVTFQITSKHTPNIHKTATRFQIFSHV